MQSSRIITAELAGETRQVEVSRGCAKGWGVFSHPLWSLVVDSLFSILSERGYYCLRYVNDLVVLIPGIFQNKALQVTRNPLEIMSEGEPGGKW